MPQSAMQHRHLPATAQHGGLLECYPRACFQRALLLEAGTLGTQFCLMPTFSANSGIVIPELDATSASLVRRVRHCPLGRRLSAPPAVPNRSARRSPSAHQGVERLDIGPEVCGVEIVNRIEPLDPCIRPHFDLR